jgi:hypothetical protein
MQQVKFGSEKYEAIFKAGFAVGVAYNNFNAAVSAALECVRKCQGSPSHAEINRPGFHGADRRHRVRGWQ